MGHPGHLREDDQQQLKALLARSPGLTAAAGRVRTFVIITTNREGDKLRHWIANVCADEQAGPDEMEGRAQLPRAGAVVESSEAPNACIGCPYFWWTQPRCHAFRRSTPTSSTASRRQRSRDGSTRSPPSRHPGRRRAEAGGHVRACSATVYRPPRDARPPSGRRPEQRRFGGLSADRWNPRPVGAADALVRAPWVLLHAVYRVAWRCARMGGRPCPAHDRRGSKMGEHEKPPPDPQKGTPPPNNADGEVPPAPPSDGKHRK